MGFEEDAGRLVRLLAVYQEASKAKKHPAVKLAPIGELVRQLRIEELINQGSLSGEALEDFMERYLNATTRLHHPGYLAHQVSVPHYAGALGALVDGFTNNPMAVYEMGPPATAIECFMINWLLQRIGWKPAPLSSEDEPSGDHAGGVLTHGGSLANLTALIAARNHTAPEVWNEGNPGDLAILVSGESHYSVTRAAGILGIGASGVVPLALDRRGVVIPDCLPAALDRVRRMGRRPMALVANACSTAFGLYDPLAEIGAFCQEQGIWLHVDGAHGASALLSPRQRHRLRGVELADSLTWDAHKMMRTPPLCTAVLVRDHRTLDQAFEQEASYLFHDKQQPGVDLIHRTIECTKAALGLKLFLVVAAMGEQGLAEYLDRQVDLAHRAWRYLNDQPDFSCPVEPQSNILCFAFKDWDREHLWMRDRLIDEGNFHLSTTQAGGRWYLRAVFMNPGTGINDIMNLVDAIRQQNRPPPP